MDYKEYLENKKETYRVLLEYLDKEENSESNFEDLNEIFINQSIQEKKEDLNTLFHLLLNISNNHHRYNDFFSKIERILSLFKSEIPKFFTNDEIFNIFKSNKRILLFLIEERILIITKTIANKLSNGWYKKCKYHFYFYPEIKKFLDIKQLEKISKSIEMKEIKSIEFNQNRKNGENNSYLCKLIQNDEIDEFIIFVNKTNFSLSNSIEPTMYETNFYLLNKDTSLIDYAAFYGSIQIFRYLYMNKVNVSPYTWIYSIHGRNPNIIHLLEEYQIKPFNKSFQDCFNESIKCHHNEIADYIQNNLLENSEDKSVSVKCYNFQYFPNENEIINKVEFYFACKYDNFFIAKYFLENFAKDFDLNEVFTEENIQHTVLTSATKERNKEIVELLLSKPSIDVNFKSVFYKDCKKSKRNNFRIEKNSLHIAVEENYEEIVKILLKNENIDVNDYLQYSDTGKIVLCHVEKTALNIAIEKEYVNIVEILLQHPNIDINKKLKHNDCNFDILSIHDRYIEKIALILAVEKENLKILSLLLNHPNIDVNITSRLNDYIYVRDHGCKGNKYAERTALSIAIEKNNMKMVQLLLKNHVIDLNSLLFFYICCYDHVTEDSFKTDHYIYKDYVDYHEDVDNIQFIELNQMQNNVEFTFEIEFDGFTSKQFFCKQISPLFMSVSERNVDITRILLKCPSTNINLLSYINKNNERHAITPLQKAIDDKSMEIIKLLKENGAFNS